MKRSFLKAVVLFVAVVFSSSIVAQNTDELKAKIEKINKEMQAAMLNGNSEASLAYYAEDAISLPSYSKMAQGIEAIKKTNEQMLTSGMKITKFETNTQMINTCENNILEVGTYNMSFTYEGNSGEISDAGKYITIWQQQPDGSLKITVEMWNSDTFPASGM